MQNLVKILIVMVLVMGIVGAVPPLTTEFIGDTGLDVEANVQSYYKTNEGAEVHIFVFNKSDGQILGGDSVNCSVELTDHNGSVVLAGYPTSEDNHFHMIRPPAVVDSAEVYALTIVCNNSDVAGYKTAFFEANELGRDINEDAILNGITIFLFFGISIFFLIFARTTEEEGVKLFFNVIGYIILFFAIGGSYIMLQLTQSGIQNLGKGMLFTIGIVFIVIMFYIFINLTRTSLAMFRAKKGFGSELDNPATF